MTRTFTLRERPASDYTLIEVRQGSPIQDFTFTDFDGKTRKLSDFRGKYVLLHLWGSPGREGLEQQVALLRPVFDRFGDDARFVLVGLNVRAARGGRTPGSASGSSAAAVRPTWPQILPRGGAEQVLTEPESQYARELLASTPSVDVASAALGARPA